MTFSSKLHGAGHGMANCISSARSARTSSPAVSHYYWRFSGSDEHPWWLQRAKRIARSSRPRPVSANRNKRAHKQLELRSTEKDGNLEYARRYNINLMMTMSSRMRWWIGWYLNDQSGASKETRFRFRLRYEMRLQNLWFFFLCSRGTLQHRVSHIVHGEEVSLSDNIWANSIRTR